MTEHPRISLAPDVLVGKPVIRGTRLAVEFVIGLIYAKPESGPCHTLCCEPPILADRPVTAAEPSPYFPASRMAMSFFSRSLARSESGMPFLAASAAR